MCIKTVIIKVDNRMWIASEILYAPLIFDHPSYIIDNPLFARNSGNTEPNVRGPSDNTVLHITRILLNATSFIRATYKWLWYLDTVVKF